MKRKEEEEKNEPNETKRSVCLMLFVCEKLLKSMRVEREKKKEKTDVLVLIR